MKQEVQQALASLKKYGYNISSNTLARHKDKVGRKLTRKEIRKFHDWVQWSGETNQYFIVALRGKDHNTITFHTLEGYAKIVAHINEVRTRYQKREGRNGNAA